MPATAIENDIMFQRILFATDFSEVPTTALGYAAGLARRYASTLELANVLDLSATMPSVEVILSDSLKTIKHIKEMKLDQLVQRISEVRTRTKVIEGFDPASLLIDEAVNDKSDLIVMGTSSKRGLKRLALGSIAEKTIREAPCPVLTVGPHVPSAPEGPLAFHRIIYATDFSAQATKAAEIAAFLTNSDKAQLYLCHVMNNENIAHDFPDAVSVNQLSAVAPKSLRDCHPECIVEHGNAAEAILRLESQLRADLIILGARRSSFWLDNVSSGLTPAILAKATCPVLTVC